MSWQATTTERREYQRKKLARHELIGEFIVASISPEDLAELNAWERANLDGRTTGTSDWPKWKALGIPDLGDAYLPRRRWAPPRPKTRIPRGLRWTVWERDNFTCVQCEVRRELHVDHILPESQGGAAVLENLQTLCRRCNTQKGIRTAPFQLRLRPRGTA